MDGAPVSVHAKLVHITPISRTWTYGRYIYSQWDYKPTYNWGHHLAPTWALEFGIVYGSVNLLTWETPMTLERNLSTLFTGTALLSRKHSPNKALV